MKSRFGLSEKTIERICSVLSSYSAVEKAFIYGSRAKGNFREGSDIDIALTGIIDPKILGDIADNLDELLLPYTIDLSVYETLKNDKLREHIDRVGKLLYEKNMAALQKHGFMSSPKSSLQGLPKGWEIKTLGEVIQLEYGKPLPDTKRKTSGKYPVYGANGEKDRSDEYYHDEPSIIVGRKGSAGEINLTEARFWPLDVTYFVKFDKKQYDLGFLYNLLYSLELQKLAKGVKPGINRNDVYSITAKFPPLSEQKRIVAILDEAFSGIARAKEIAERNLANAREIFESYLNKVFTSPSKGWKELKLAEICEVKDGTHDSPQYHNEGIPFATQKNIRPDGFSLNNAKLISKQDHENYYRRSNVAFGDILISMIGANRGMACIVDTKTVFSIKNVCLVKRSHKINHKYLLHYLNSQRAKSFVQSFSKGGAQEFIGLTELRQFPIANAPLDEQNAIVLKLDELLNEAKKLESIYTKKVLSLEELKKSILNQAFNGKL